MKKPIFTILAIVIMSFNASALFEIRGGYGINTPADDSADLQGGGAVGLSTMTGFHLDAIISPPALPFGFGLRYETMGMEIEQTGANFDTDMERISAIVNYRLIDTLVFVGLIGTIGFSNQMTVDFAGTENEYEADLTYSVGGEVGASLGLLFVGAEAGYFIADFEEKNAAVSNLGNIDASGIYGKVFVGFGF